MKLFQNRLKSTRSFMSMIILIFAFSAVACSDSSTNRTVPKRIAFIADKDTDETYELYVVKPDGTDLVKASGPMVLNGYVWGFRWSPDDSKIAYMASQDTANVFELYVVNADGSGQIKVSGTMVSGGDVFPNNFFWSPDGSKIAYMASQDTANVFELYVVNADGSGLVKVSGTITNPDGDVDDISWSPDSSKIVYNVDGDIDGVYEIYVVNSDGTGRSKVSGALVAGRFAINPKWSPDSSKIVYIADQDTNDVFELYVVNSDGSGLIKVSGTMMDLESDVGLSNFTWSPDGSKIAYRADQDTNEVFELYVVNSDGTGRIKVSGTMDGDVDSDSKSFRWSSDGSKIVYLADQDTAGVLELYVVNSDGTGRIKVSGTMVLNGDVQNWSPTWAWFPDDSKIAYTADQDTDGVDELYVVNSDGTGRIKVSGTMVSGGNIDIIYLSSDGRKIAYLADQDTDGVNELYVVNSDGTGRIKVSGTLVSGGAVSISVWSPDGSKILYGADQDTVNVQELYVVNPDGSSLVKVSGTMVSGGNVLMVDW
jgi:Tol biopolymer transport system component